MAQSRETVSAEAEQYYGGCAMHGNVWKNHFGRERYPDDDRDGNEVSERNRHDRPRDRGGGFLLKAERDGEKPAHARIDAVVAAQKEECEPDIAIAHTGGRSLGGLPESFRPRLIAEELGG